MKSKKILAVILGVLLLLGMVGCSAEAPMEGGVPVATDAGMNRYDNDYIEKEESPSAESTALPENRKLIQTFHMDVETEDLDVVLQQIDSRTAELSGYVENSYIRNGSAYSGRRYRSATITLRIPAKTVDAFVDRVGEISNIVSSQKTVEDVTLRYVETEGRMKALQVEEQRLLELLAKAETMEDLLKIEDRLTNVRTELEQVTSALRVYDNQVDYATVHLNVTEVKEYTEVTEPETVWDRIAEGFADSWENIGVFLQELFVFFVVASPYLLLMGGSALVVVLIIRLSIRRKRKKKEE